jgi:hypothetical protein
VRPNQSPTRMKAMMSVARLALSDRHARPHRPCVASECNVSVQCLCTPALPRDSVRACLRPHRGAARSRTCTVLLSRLPYSKGERVPRTADRSMHAGRWKLSGHARACPCLRACVRAWGWGGVRSTRTVNSGKATLPLHGRSIVCHISSTSAAVRAKRRWRVELLCVGS